jgi:hypothetical protein
MPATVDFAPRHAARENVSKAEYHEQFEAGPAHLPNQPQIMFAVRAMNADVIRDYQ